MFLLKSLSVKFHVLVIKAKKLFFSLLWGRGCCFGMTKLDELLYIFFLKLPELLRDFFCQSSSERLHMEVP